MKGGVESEGKVVALGLGLSHTVVLVENVRVASGRRVKEEAVKVVKEVKEEVVVEEKKVRRNESPSDELEPFALICNAGA